MGWRRAGNMKALATGAVLLSCAAILAGCVKEVPTPVPTHTASSASPSATATPAPTAVPKLVVGGTAQQNLAYFNLIGHRLLDNNASANANGRTIVDYFVNAGFTKKDMEVTPDKTSIGLAAWNIEFSVKFKDECIVGQAGNVGFQSFVAPVVSTNTCLIGLTRPIDW
jgi:hypothetical protein